MYYNKELFREAGLDPDNPPTNLEGLIDAGQRITDHSQGVWGLWFAKSGSWVARDFYSVYWQFEPNLLSEDQRSVSPGFGEAARQALEVMSAFINEYEISPAEPADFELFVQDRVGMAFSQITHLLLLEQTPGLDFASAPFPQFGEHPATFALGHNFVMPRGRDQSEERVNASLVFFDWFANHSLEWVAGGKVPASLVTLQDERFTGLTNQVVAASQLEYMKLPPAILQMPAINEVVIETLEELYARRINVDQAVDQMINRINQALASQ
jgi:multiple sugar transport system substrate-binding protein